MAHLLASRWVSRVVEVAVGHVGSLKRGRRVKRDGERVDVWSKTKGMRGGAASERRGRARCGVGQCRVLRFLP